MRRSLQLHLALFTGFIASALAEPISNKGRAEAEARAGGAPAPQAARKTAPADAASPAAPAGAPLPPSGGATTWPVPTTDAERALEAAALASLPAPKLRAERLRLHREYAQAMVASWGRTRSRTASALIEEILNVEVRIRRPIPGIKLSQGDVFYVSRFHLDGMVEICSGQAPGTARLAELNIGAEYEMRKVAIVDPEVIQTGLRDGRLQKLSIKESFERRTEHEGIIAFYRDMIPISHFLAKEAWSPGPLAVAAGEVFTIVGVSDMGMRCQIVGPDGKPGRLLSMLYLAQLDSAIERGIVEFVPKE